MAILLWLALEDFIWLRGAKGTPFTVLKELMISTSFIGVKGIMMSTPLSGENTGKLHPSALSSVTVLLENHFNVYFLVSVIFPLTSVTSAAQ